MGRKVKIGEKIKLSREKHKITQKDALEEEVMSFLE